MPKAFINSTRDHALHNAAPSAQLALIHQKGSYPHADMVSWGWRLH